MRKSCYHDPDEACHVCRRYEKRIADLENSTWRRNSVARVLIEEGDQHGTWLRVGQIRSIRSTDEGMEITVA